MFYFLIFIIITVVGWDDTTDVRIVVGLVVGVADGFDLLVAFADELCIVEKESVLSILVPMSGIDDENVNSNSFVLCSVGFVSFSVSVIDVVVIGVVDGSHLLFVDAILVSN